MLCVPCQFLMKLTSERSLAFSGVSVEPYRNLRHARYARLSAVYRGPKPGALFHGMHVGRPLERFGRWLAGVAPASDGSKELIQARWQIGPSELERLLRILVDDFVLDPATEVRRGARHERVGLAVDEDGAAAVVTKQDLI